MSTLSRTTSSGTNYRGGVGNTAQGGSNVVGWDNGLVRSEVYSFTTGSLPVSSISFISPSMTLGSGSTIAVRCAISTSQTAYNQSSGGNTGYAVNINGTTSFSISLAANTTYYITFFPGTTKDSGDWYGWYYCDGNPFTINLSQIDYTYCTAPTSVWVDSTITAPGGYTTLHWFGASAGTNMYIQEYDIFQSTSLNGNYTYLGSTSSTFYLIQSPTTRGSTYYYKVRSWASVQPYNSEIGRAHV